ncbi:SagB family peptide dehydrogenase [Streptomyces sp. NPDC087300]|uniref:SagB family peptide dehydrogenase n=1 Tax=Streptomyces sp. NPDC087300 TaxID=3365780 RepID=UPI0037F3BD35
MTASVTAAHATGAAALHFLTTGHLPPDALPTADTGLLPPLYKSYPAAQRHPLTSQGETPGATSGERLSWLLRQANGLTRMRWMSGIMPTGLATAATEAARERRVILAPGRPGAASGSRYPVEVYVAHADVDGTAPGLSHYDPAHHALERLRDGDGRELLLADLAEPPSAPTEFVLLLSSVLWRNSAKYGSFGYRLQSLDCGVAVAQAVAAAESAGLRAEVHLRFDDRELDRHIGLDAAAESVFAVVTVHRPTDGARRPGPPVPAASWWRSDVPAERPAPRPLTGIPAVADAAALHQAILDGPRDGTGGGTGEAPESGPADPAPEAASAINLPAVHPDPARGFTRRRTVYGYRPAPVPPEVLASLLATATVPVRSDLPPAPSGAGEPVRIAGVVRGVPSVPTGAYLYDRGPHALLPTRGADAARAVLHAAKSPMLADECRTATATLVVCGDPHGGVLAHGDRWYRMLTIAAGTAVQRVALAAAAAGLDSHVHCDFDLTGTADALGLPAPLRPLVLVTVGRAAPDRTDPQLPLRGTITTERDSD